MNAAEQVKLLQAMTDESDSEILLAYLRIAADKVLQRAYPFGAPEDHADTLDRYSVVQVEIAAYLLNKRGAEGETVHKENGVERSYENGDVPASLLRQIVPYVGCL